MHEMSLADGVARIIEEQAKEHGFEKVLSVRLEIGKLAHVDPDALIFCFGAVVKGTVAEGARLVIERAEGLVWCFSCAAQVAIRVWGDACPKCGSYDLQAAGGQDMRILDLEVA
jgi:hydrogenase nickel incorporation protein HypA/HybF